MKAQPKVDGIRPEVRKVIAAVGKQGPWTLPEIREAMRAMLATSLDGTPWISGSVTVNCGVRPVLHLAFAAADRV